MIIVIKKSLQWYQDPLQDHFFTKCNICSRSGDIATFVCLFIRDPVGPMVQHNLQEKMHTSQVAHRQCLLTLSPSLAWAHHQQCLHAGQPDQLTRGLHSQHEVRPLNTNKPHSDAKTTRQTTHGQRRTIHVGNSSVTDITIQRFFETLGADFIYLQVLNLKSFTAITKQSSWIVHPMKLRSIV